MRQGDSNKIPYVLVQDHYLWPQDFRKGSCSRTNWWHDGRTVLWTS